MTMDIEQVRKFADLLDDPAPAVVKDLCDEIVKLSSERGEYVATIIVTPDNKDVGGISLTIDDYNRINALPKGTKLYAVRPK